MKSAAYNICELIVAAGLGTLGTDLFYSDLPADVSGLIVGVFDTGGYPPEGNPTSEIFRPTVMVAVKGERDQYQEAYDRAYLLFSTLHGQGNVSSVTDFRILQIWSISDVLWVGYDEENRPEFTINFSVQRAPKS